MSYELQNYTKLLDSDDLKKSIWANKVCIFLGAGVARNIGMPDWQGLASNITQFCLKHNILNHSQTLILQSFTDPLKIISYCIQETEEKKQQVSLNQHLQKLFIKEPLKYYRKSNNNVYKLLLELYQSEKVLIVQTNYDHVIEEAVNESDTKRKLQPYVPFIDEKQLKLTNNLIVYLHGKFEKNYNNIILTKQKYNEVYVLKNSKVKQEKFFNDLLKEYTIIMLGYSLQDNEIVQLIANRECPIDFKSVNIIIDSCKAKLISSEIDARYWESSCNKNLKIYTYDTETRGFNQFYNVVEALKNKICKNADESILSALDDANIENIPE